MKHLACLAAILLVGAPRSDAAFVTYTETATVSGSLNGKSFTNSLLTLTATGDTSNITTSTAKTPANQVTVNFTVTGLGGGTLTGLYIVFSTNSNGGSAGIEQGAPYSLGLDVLDTQSSALATYSLATSIGPVSGSAALNSGISYASTSGDLVLNTVSGSVSFQAIVSTTVPEPSSLALCGMAGLVSLGVARLRRRGA